MCCVASVLDQHEELEHSLVVRKNFGSRSAKKILALL